jgi:hypothetical protein
MRLRLQQQVSTFGGIIDSPRYPRCFFNVFDNDDPSRDQGYDYRCSLVPLCEGYEPS